MKKNISEEDIGGCVIKSNSSGNRLQFGEAWND